MQAAVDVNDSSGNETGNRRGQVHDLLGFAEAADRRNIIETTEFFMISVAPNSGKLKR